MWKSGFVQGLLIIILLLFQKVVMNEATRCSILTNFTSEFWWINQQIQQTETKAENTIMHKSTLQRNAKIGFFVDLTFTFKMKDSKFKSDNWKMFDKPVFWAYASLQFFAYSQAYPGDRGQNGLKSANHPLLHNLDKWHRNYSNTCKKNIEMFVLLHTL